MKCQKLITQEELLEKLNQISKLLRQEEMVRRADGLKNNQKWNMKYKLKYPWSMSYDQARQRCTNQRDINYLNYGGRGIKFLLKRSECHLLWIRDEGDYMNRPSIDRINTDGNYEYSNCQFVELRENIRKDKAKVSVVRIDNHGNKKKYNSICEAARDVERFPSNISAVIRGIKPTCAGFKWRYLTKEQ